MILKLQWLAMVFMAAPKINFTDAMLIEKKVNQAK